MRDINFNAEVKSTRNSFLSLYDTSTLEPILTDADEIQYILKNFKNKKSTGPDQQNTKLL